MLDEYYKINIYFKEDIEMKNNLTKKEINNLYNWAKKYGIEELQTKDINELLNIKELIIMKDMVYKKTFYIPNEFFKLVNLKELHIKSANLKSLPKEIGNLVNLEEFSIGSYRSYNNRCKLKNCRKKYVIFPILKKL